MKGTKKYKTCLSVIMAVFVCMAGSITVFAYNPPDTIANQSMETAGTTDFFVREKPASQEKLVSDCFAVSDDGTIYDISCIDENGRAACNHNYSVQVEVTKHIKNSNGGCTMKVYEGYKCGKCGYVKYGDLSSTHTYVSCPH